MEIITHLREIEVSIENISRHIMWIRAREANTIKSWNLIDFLKEFTKWGLHIWTCPSE